MKFFETSTRSLAAAINLPPNISGLLRRFGVIPGGIRATEVRWVSEYEQDGSLIWQEDLGAMQKSFVHVRIKTPIDQALSRTDISIPEQPWQTCHEADVYTRLRELITSEKEGGIPVKLHSKAQIVSIDGEKDPSITLATGEHVTGDLIVVLDGINSIQPNTSTSQEARVASILLPMSKVLDNPKTRRFVERRGEISTYRHDNKTLMMFPCRENTELSLILTQSEGISENDAMSLKSDLATLFRGFHADVLNLIGMVDAESVCWQEPFNYSFCFTEGPFCVILGNNSLSPHRNRGQDTVKLIEDAAALAAVLPLGTQLSDLKNRLALHEKCRSERVAKLQHLSQGTGFSNKVSLFNNCDIDGDAYSHAEGILLRELGTKARFARMPLGYGITPGPRQDPRGIPYSLKDATIHTAYMTCLTPKSYISTMMPTAEYTLQKPGGWTAVTFSNTKMENISWLGGRSYSMFGFFIHDVCYTPLNSSNGTASIQTSSPEHKNQGRNGKVGSNHGQVEGTYLSVLFENLPDPILSGREELGFAKLYATLTATDSIGKGNTAVDSRSYTLAAGWEGAAFCTLSIPDLVPTSAPSVRKPPGPLLHCKVIPITGSSSGGVDALYATVTPTPAAGEYTQYKICEAVSLGGVKLEFTELEGRELEKAFPTLCHVIRRLRGIQVGDIIEARVVEGVGAGNVEGQLRW